jgi:hypothetical protein
MLQAGLSAGLFFFPGNQTYPRKTKRPEPFNSSGQVSRGSSLAYACVVTTLS